MALSVRYNCVTSKERSCDASHIQEHELAYKEAQP